MFIRTISTHLTRSCYHLLLVWIKKSINMGNLKCISLLLVSYFSILKIVAVVSFLISFFSIYVCLDIFFSMGWLNQIACCAASTIEAHSIPLIADEIYTSERESKNLLLFPFQPIQPHSYGPQSRFGFGSRQTNSPINPAIGMHTRS